MSPRRSGKSLLQRQRNQSKAVRTRRDRANWLRVEILEERVVLSVDLNRYGGFLPTALDRLQEAGINDQIYKVALPLIANELSQNKPAASQVLDPVADKLQQAFASLSTTSNPSEAQFISALTSNLGPLLAGGITRVAGGNPTDPSTNSVEYAFTVHVDETTLTDLPTITLTHDLGFSGLGIDLDADVLARLRVGFDFKLQVGLVNNNDGTYGFYFDTTAPDELIVRVGVEVAAGSAVSGTVGLLQFGATSNPDVNGKPSTSLTVNYSANLVDPDGKLRASELASGINFVTSATIDARVGLGMTAEFGGSAINPKVKAEFQLQWFATGNPEVASLAAFSSEVPAVAFNNVRIGLTDGLLAGFIQPIVQNVRQVTAPIEPIVSTLAQKPFAALGGAAAQISYLDIITTYLGISKDQLHFLDTVVALVTMAEQLDTEIKAGSSVEIPLGSFTLKDVRLPTTAFAAPPVEADALGSLAASDQGFYKTLTTVNNGTVKPADGSGFRLSFLEDPTQFFKLFIGDPSATLFTFTLPDLNVGVSKYVALLSAPLPPLPYPFVRAELFVQGGIGLQGHLSLGYDAKGLVSFRADPSRPDALFGGLYIDTTRPLITITGWKNGAPSDDIISFGGAVIVDTSITAFTASLGVPLPPWIDDIVSGTLSFSGSGDVSIGLQGRLEVNLVGNEGRLRPAELGPGSCLFEIDPARSKISIGGGIHVRATATASVPGFQEIFNVLGKVTGTKPIKVGVDWNSGEISILEFPSVTLFTFSANCNALSGDPALAADPQLALLLPDGTGTLRLNVGEAYVGGPPSDGKRQIQPDEINEIYRIRHVSGSPDSAEGETVRIEAFGTSQEFSGVKRIIADAGHGEDQILLDADVLAPSVLNGGDGNDVLVAGSGQTIMDGGAGNDTLIGSPEADTIVGGDGNDIIDARAGDDLIVGGLGDDRITGGSGRDILRESGDVNFTLSSIQLTGNGTDTLATIEVVELTGGPSANTMTVRQFGGELVTLAGLDGNDQYLVAINGAGNTRYVVNDAAGDDTLTVQGTDRDDNFLLVVGQVSEKSEIVEHTGVVRIIVDAGAGQDRIAVQATASGTRTQVLGGADSDLISVSSQAVIDNNGDLAGIQGTLSIDAGTGGANRLVVSNFAGGPPQPIILQGATDGYSAIIGPAPVPILYKASGGGAFFDLPSTVSYPGYDPNYGVIIRGTDGWDDEFQIRATAANATTKTEGNGGNDRFIISSDLPPTLGNLNGIQGALTVDGGIGAFDDGTPESNLRGLISLDLVIVNADADYTLTDTMTRLKNGQLIPDLTASGAILSARPAGISPAVVPNIQLISVEAARLIGGASANRLDTSGFSGTVELDGMGGNDVLIGGSGDTILDGGDGDDELFAGTDWFLNPGLGSQANVLLGGGGASTLLGGAGNDLFHADLGSSATLIGGDGDDTFLITNPAVGVTAPVAGITIDGGGQAGDTLNLIGGGGSTYNQTYVAGPLAGEGQIVTTNNHNPTGLTISQFVRFRGLATINDSITANQLSLLAASPAAPIAGASGADLAAGMIRLTVGGNPFPVINFRNKTNASVQLADGRTFSSLPIAPPEPVIEPAPILTIGAATPAGPPAIVIPPTPAPVAVAAAVATPRPTLLAGPALVASTAATTSTATVELITHRSMAAIRAARRAQVQAKKQAHAQALAQAHAKSHVATPHPKGPSALRAAAAAARVKAQRRLAATHR